MSVRCWPNLPSNSSNRANTFGRGFVPVAGKRNCSSARKSLGRFSVAGLTNVVGHPLPANYSLIYLLTSPPNILLLKKIGTPPLLHISELTEALTFPKFEAGMSKVHFKGHAQMSSHPLCAFTLIRGQASGWSDSLTIDSFKRLAAKHTFKVHTKEWRGPRPTFL